MISFEGFFILILQYILSDGSTTSSSLQSQVVTFSRDASIRNAAKAPIISTMNQVNLLFKTKQDYSYLFYIGAQPSKSEAGMQFLMVYLDNRKLTVRIRHDKSVDYAFSVACVSNYSSCADNHWHSVTVSRKRDTIKVIVDNIIVLDKEVGDVISHVISQYIIFGGRPPSSSNDETADNLKNFKGCLKNIIYSADNLDLDILRQAKSKKHFIAEGEIYFNKCSDLFPVEPVSFNTDSSYVTLRGWAWAQKGKMQFTFKTVESNALLVYQQSENFKYDQFDFYAFEIRNSLLHFSINTGSGTFTQIVSKISISDGANHYVKLWFDDGKVEVQLDGDKKLERDNKFYRILDISGDLYIGGIPDDLVYFLPHSVWTGILRHGFVGCLLDISVNDVQYDLALKIESENISGISVGCPTNQLAKNVCENRPCMDGECTVGYNRYVCDCSRTNYTGKTCAKIAPLVKFNGFQYMIVSLANGMQSECEEITLRFLTTRPDGILLITKSTVSGANDRLEISLEDGRINVLINFGKGNKVIKSAIDCFDRKWHTIKLQRYQRSVILTVDDYKTNHSMTGSSKFILKDIINVGRNVNGKENKYFTGFMMHFTFNGVNYFELAKDQSPQSIEVTATILDADITREFPVTFTTTSSYLRLPKINMYGNFKLDFFLKTKVTDGSVLQLYGKSGDYLILEIVSGYLNLLFNWGNGFNKKVNKYVPINDEKWHRITLIREDSKTFAFAFRIDGLPQSADAHVQLQKGGFNFNSFEDLFLGSAEKYITKKKGLQEKVVSKHGFIGCISSFYMNQTIHTKNTVYQNLLSIAKANNGVVEGCAESSQYQVTCQPNTCNSGGRCVQQWTRIRCDCSLTSFTGEKCDRVSKTLKFNEYPAYLIFKLYPSKNTTMDELAFGIQTTAVVSTPIVKIEGEGRQPDFISAELVKDKGRAVMIIDYNMGRGTLRLTQPAINIADGFYHRVAFRRNGNIASLQIDDLDKKLFIPRVKTGIHFNQQRTIFVGKPSFGNEKEIQDVEYKSMEWFSGFLSGLYFNRIPLSDMIDNISYPGIKLLNRSNVYVENKFVPHFKTKPIMTPEKSRINDELRSAVQNWSDEGEPTNKENVKSSPIITAKSNCSNALKHLNSNCKPMENPRSIIQPKVTFTSNNLNENQKRTTSTKSVISTQSNKSNATPNRQPDIQNSSVINIWLIIGFSLGGCVLLIFITCFIYRCCRKDEGSYSVEDDRVFIDPTCKPLNSSKQAKAIELHNNSRSLNKKPHNNSKFKSLIRDKSSDTKEWYV